MQPPRSTRYIYTTKWFPTFKFRPFNRQDFQVEYPSFPIDSEAVLTNSVQNAFFYSARAVKVRTCTYLTNLHIINQVPTYPKPSPPRSKQPTYPLHHVI